MATLIICPHCSQHVLRDKKCSSCYGILDRNFVPKAPMDTFERVVAGNPACDICGNITEKSGTGYKCPTCGNKMSCC